MSADLRAAYAEYARSSEGAGSIQSRVVQRLVEACYYEIRGSDGHPGEPHEFRTYCRRCGEPGRLHVSLITDDELVEIKPRPTLEGDPE